MTEYKYGKRILEEAQKLDEDEPDLTSWCGNCDCEIVNYLLEKIRNK